MTGTQTPIQPILMVGFFLTSSFRHGMNNETLFHKPDRKGFTMSDKDTDFDDSIDSMRDGLGKAIAEARKHLKEFPEDSVLLVRIRETGAPETATRWNHRREKLEFMLDSLNEALEKRLFAAMDNIFIPYPKKSGETESFGKSEPKTRAIEKVREIVYPHLVGLAGLISKAKAYAEESETTEEVEALRLPAPVTPEAILTELLNDARAKNAR